MALMENMDTLNQHQKEVGESAGSAKKMMDEAYGQSLDARIQDLKRSFEQLYEKITNSEQLKWLVSEFTQLTTAIANIDGKTIAFISTIGLATLAVSKLVTMNKLLMGSTSANTLTNGFTKFIGILTGMTPLMGTTKVATEALAIAQAEATMATEALALAEERALLAKEALITAQSAEVVNSFEVAVAEGEVMLATNALADAQIKATATTEALVTAQAEASAEQAGLTGLSGAWALLSNGIKATVTSAVAFMMTPLGMAITAISVAIGIGIKAFYDYKQHEAEVEAQSKSLKDAIDGVNEAIKNGDTKGASDKLSKLAEQEKKYQDTLKQKKDLEKQIADIQDDMKSNPLKSEGDLQVMQSLNEKLVDVNKSLDDQKEAFDKAGVTVQDYADAQSKVSNEKIIDGIKEQTKAQLEHRENLEQAQQEYNNYISTIQSLYTEYQTLSSQESLSAEQKTQLGSVVEQLQDKMSGLNVSIDANGNAYITNSPLIEANIEKLQSEGMTVDNLSAIRISDSKINSQWQIGNTQVTYSQITQRIEMYKAEIRAIQALMQARIAGSAGGEGSETYEHMSIGKAQAMEADSDEYKQYKEKADALREYEGAKKEIDSIYQGVGSVPYSGGTGGGNIPSGGGDYFPSGGGEGKKGKGSGKSAEQEAKEEHEKLVKEEKQTITDITDAYKDAKDKIDDSIGEIEASIEGLGDIDDSNFTKRIELGTQKIAKQKEEVANANDQLEKLKNTSLTTSEAQKELESKILSANKELRTQTLEVAKLEKELSKYSQDQLKEMYEKQKEIDTERLDANQKKQTQDFEKIKKDQENFHQDKLDYLDEESKKLERQQKQLEEQNEEQDKANELQEKENDLKDKELELEKAQGQQNIQVYKKDNNGNWNFSYVADEQNIKEKQKAVDEAKKALDETKRKQELEKAKKEIEEKKNALSDEKDAENKLYDTKKEYLEKYSEELKEAQERDKKRLENNYADIEEKSKKMLESLKQTYGDNWDGIAKSISSASEIVKKNLKDLTDLNANFTATEATDAINSGDVGGFLTKNKDKMNQTANVDTKGINGYLNSISTSTAKAKDSFDGLLTSYKEMVSMKIDSIGIDDEDVETNKTRVSKITKNDEDELTQQFTDVKAHNTSLDTEQNTHYANELSKQDTSQKNELTNLETFFKTYLLLTNKFLELLQLTYDWRFNNMSIIVSGFVQNMLQALVQMEQDYEKYAQMWNKVHPEDTIPSKVDISSNVSGTATYQKQTTDYQTGKLALYSADNFKAYADKIGNGIGDSLLSRLNTYNGSIGNLVSANSSSITNNTNKSNTTTNTTQVNIQQMDVNTKDAQNLLDQLLIMVKNGTILS